MADVLAWRIPVSRDLHLSSKRSKKIGVWSVMVPNSQIMQDLDEKGCQWCVVVDSINGRVKEVMGGVPNPCLIGQNALP